MAIQAKVKFVQGATVGVPGISLIGLAGQLVTASDGLAGQGDPVQLYRWTWIDVPTGSAIPIGQITQGSVTSITFTPDVAGDYEIMLEAYGRDSKRYVDRRVFRVLNADGLPLPSFTGDKDSLNFGGRTTGWKLDMEAWFAFFGGGGGGGGAGSMSSQPIASVTATPGFVVIGSYRPASTANHLLRVHGVTSQSGLSLNFRMVDVTSGSPNEGQVVANSTVSITATRDTYAETAVPFLLTAGRDYQIQAECVGPAGFAVATSATPRAT